MHVLCKVWYKKKLPTIKQMFLDFLVTLKYIHVFERTYQKTHSMILTIIQN